MDPEALLTGVGVTVIVGEHGCGTSTLLRALHVPPRTVLLSQPPGDEWADPDLAAHALGRPELVGREFWTLSGGERQRVRLGTALSQDGVLLLDEPLGYLDDQGVSAAFTALQGRCVVMVCKSDPRAWGKADRLLELVDGNLRQVELNAEDAGR